MHDYDSMYITCTEEKEKEGGTSKGGSMEIVRGDLLELPALLKGSKGGADGYELVVCMGDTLTHLQVRHWHHHLSRTEKDNVGAN